MSIATTAFARVDRLYLLPLCPNRLRFLGVPLLLPLFSRQRRLLPLQMAAAPSVDAYRWRMRAASSGDSLDENRTRKVPGLLSLDELLSAAEVLCVTPSIVCSIWCLISPAFPGATKRPQVSFGSKIYLLQYSLLVVVAVIGSFIRWRQWRRIWRVNDSGMGVSLIGKVEKVEDDIRSSATIIKLLSEQLEKLSSRFRLSQKSLKEPIIETAALAQKNSEATRALTLQEEILEMELREIQKVLLAMQVVQEIL